MKWVKKLVYVVIIAVILFILVPVLLMIFVNPNQFKSTIQTQVTNTLHRSFDIQGDLHWTFYPSIGIRADGVSLGNPPGFGNQSFFMAKSIDFNIAVKPLLSKEIHIGRISIDSPTLHLIKNKAGVTNWALSASKTNNISPNNNQHASPGILALGISDISITHGLIIYDDFTQNKHLNVDKINFSSKNINVNTIFPVNLSMILSSNTLGAPVQLSMQSQVKITLPDNIKFMNTQVSINHDLTITGQESIRLNQVPVWKVNMNFNNIDIQKLLVLFKKANLTISGQSNVVVNLAGQGAELNRLNGDVKFAVKDGVFHGMDLYYYSQLADSVANHERPSAKDTGQTPFGDMTGTLQIQNGVVNNHDLMITAPQITAAGSGTANLMTQQLDYRLSLQRLTSGSQVKPRGPAIPIVISNTFMHPSVQVDLKSIVVNEVKSQFQNQLNQKLQEGLQSLLGK